MMEMYLDGGIYTDEKGTTAICMGRYVDKCDVAYVGLIELVGFNGASNTDILKYLGDREIKTIHNEIRLLSINNYTYQYGYLGQLPKPLYKHIFSKILDTLFAYKQHEWKRFVHE